MWQVQGMKQYLLVMTASTFMVACSDPTPKNNNVLLSQEAQTGRMRVVSAQTIKDGSGRIRDILVLKDSQTNKEYLAVMGAGVNDIVTHSNGKTTYTTEE
jgi:hypothetical protein